MKVAVIAYHDRWDEYNTDYRNECVVVADKAEETVKRLNTEHGFDPDNLDSYYFVESYYDVLGI